MSLDHIIESAARPRHAHQAFVSDVWRPRINRWLTRFARTKTIPCRLDRPLASFTFDDIPETAATAGAPLLEKHDARGTFYVAGGLLGTTTTVGRLATIEQCLALHRRGHELGSHTFSHPHLPDCEAAVIDRDVACNDAFFAQREPGLSLDNFAYPYNATSVAAKLRLQKRFASCRGGGPGVNARSVDLGLLRTVELLGDDEAPLRWLDEARRRCGWIVFLTHGVADAPPPWGCTPRLLETALMRAKDMGCEIVTVREALSRLGAAATGAGA